MVASGLTLLVHVSPHLLALRVLARVWPQGRGADWLMFSLGAYSSVLGHYGSSDGTCMSYFRAKLVCLKCRNGKGEAAVAQRVSDGASCQLLARCPAVKSDREFFQTTEGLDSMHVWVAQ